MSTQESDGITEAIEDTLRAGLLLGTRLAERRIRDREQQLRQAASASLEAANAEREHQVQERSRALAALESVYSSQWWEHASAPDISRAWTTARECQADQPRAARAVWRIADELHARYGLDVHEIDPAALGQQPQLAQRATLSDQQLRDYDRRLARDRTDLTTTVPGVVGPEQQAKIDEQTREIDELRTLIAQELTDRERQRAPEDTSSHERRELQEAQLRAGPLQAATTLESYDSPARRERLAQRLATLDIPESTIDAVILADTGQAQPPEMASTAAPSQHAAPAAAQSRRHLQRHHRRGR